MAKVSAGVLGWRLREEQLEVLIVHPGGPLWAHKDEGAWTIAKGELEPGEAAEQAAARELREETGWELAGPLLSLGSVTQKSGKVVYGFAARMDVDPSTLSSNTFPLEWPRGSGRTLLVPEVDRAGWFSLIEARQKLNPAQVPLLERLAAALGVPVPW